MNSRFSTLLNTLVGIGLFGMLPLRYAEATLKLYYDPLTGNVAFDSSETRSGGIYGYAFVIYAKPRPFDFRPENHVLISGVLESSFVNRITEGTLSAPWEGLYTIGNVMPVGISETLWKSWVSPSSPSSPLSFDYADLIGGGFPPPPEFIYGPPEGRFKNEWDLVDPDTLTWASAATLVYRAENGEVLIDTTGTNSGYICSFLLESDNAFLPGGFEPFLDVPLTGATAESVFLFADAIEPGIYSIGQILPAGMSNDQFQALFTRAHFIGRPGFSSGSFDFEKDGVPMSFQYVGVPEPSGTWLYFVGTMGLWLGRRKRS
jgi:hypothetical protein